MGWMTAAAVVGALASVASAVSSISAASSAPGAPKPQTNTNYGYDDEGNVVVEGTTKTNKHGSVYTPREKTAKEKDEIHARNNFIAQMRKNLNQAPEDRVKAYAAYEKEVSEAMHEDVDKRFAKYEQSQDEALNARGMTGSRADVDTQAELADAKLAADVGIANRAKLASEELANADRAFYLDALNQAEGGQRQDSLLAMDKANAQRQQALSGNAQAYASSAVEGAAQTLKANSINSGLKTLSDTASGLAFLYGYKGGGTTSPTRNTNPFGVTV